MADQPHPDHPEKSFDAEMQAAWERDASIMLMAAMGRAENDMINHPEFGPELRALPGAMLTTIRAAMMGTAYFVKEVFQECGWMDPVVPPPPPPDAVRNHAEQAEAA